MSPLLAAFATFVSVADAFGCFNATAQAACNATQSACMAMASTSSATCSCLSAGVTCYGDPAGASCDSDFLSVLLNECCQSQAASMSSTSSSCCGGANCAQLAGTCSDTTAANTCVSKLPICQTQIITPNGSVFYNNDNCVCYQQFSGCLRGGANCDQYFVNRNILSACASGELDFACTVCPAPPFCTGEAAGSSCSIALNTCTAALPSMTSPLYAGAACACYTTYQSCVVLTGCESFSVQTMGNVCQLIDDAAQFVNGNFSCAVCGYSESASSPPPFLCNGLSPSLAESLVLIGTLFECVPMMNPNCNVTITFGPTPPPSAAQNASRVAQECACAITSIACLAQVNCSLSAVGLTACQSMCPAAMCTAAAPAAPAAGKKADGSVNRLSVFGVVLALATILFR